MPIKKVCVFCSSSKSCDEKYQKSAADVARALVAQGYDIVYGGGDVGLMGIVAKTALDAGGHVTGIITHHLNGYEKQHETLTELFVVDSMHQRKAMMTDMADAFVVLPGGLGTLDETYEILTRKQIGLLEQKKIIIFNEYNFWAPMLNTIDYIISSGFAPETNRHIFHVVEDIPHLMEVLAGPDDEVVDPSDKWT